MSTSWLKRSAGNLWTLLKGTYERYSERNGDLLAAAFSFYALLSVAPLAVIAVSVAGLVVDPQTARAYLLHGVERASGREIANVLVTGLEAAKSQGGGIGAVIALALLLWAASKLFTVLQDGLNAIWGVEPKPTSTTWHIIRRVALKRLLSFAMVIGCGALLLISLLLQTALSTVRSSVLEGLGLSAMQGDLAFAQQLGLSLLALTVAISAVFWLLPDVRVHWRDVWTGALTTAVFMLLGTALLSLYLSRIAPNWLQGAVGSIAAFVLWSNYLAQMFLLGAALTRERACARGETVEPEPYAKLAEAE